LGQIDAKAYSNQSIPGSGDALKLVPFEETVFFSENQGFSGDRLSVARGKTVKI
jgi:hypothetical protein